MEQHLHLLVTRIFNKMNCNFRGFASGNKRIMSRSTSTFWKRGYGIPKRKLLISSNVDKKKIGDMASPFT
jgi:hypothetical protein